MKIIGQLLDIEQVPAFIRDGETVRPAFPRLHVLDGIEVQKVDVPRDYSGALPAVSLNGAGPTAVDLDVKCRTYSGKGGAVLAIDLLAVNSAPRPLTKPA